MFTQQARQQKEIATSKCQAGTCNYAKNEINLDVFEDVNIIINQQKSMNIINQDKYNYNQ